MNLLLVAYKIERDKGSEDGIGYHLAHQLRRHVSNMTIITRVNNADKLRLDPDFAGVDIIGIDVPRLLGFFKRGGRGIILYYYLWQIYVGRRVRMMRRDRHFDIVHQVTFATTWAAHFLTGPRIIWGPLINHRPVPRSFWSAGTVDFMMHEVPTRISKKIFWACDPFLRAAIRRTHRIILAYDNRPGPFSRVQAKSDIIPCAGTHFTVLDKKPTSAKFIILFVGRFIDLKGPMTALHALRHFLDKGGVDRTACVMRFVGTGPRETAMRAFAKRHDIPIDIVPWIDQAALTRHYAEASVFLYPSFEGQGLVVTEALAHLCPVICLEGTGPHALAAQAALAVPVADFDTTCHDLARQLRRVYDDFFEHPTSYAALCGAARQRAGELTWSALAEKIAEHYDS